LRLEIHFVMLYGTLCSRADSTYGKHNNMILASTVASAIGVRVEVHWGSVSTTTTTSFPALAPGRPLVAGLGSEITTVSRQIR